MEHLIDREKVIKGLERVYEYIKSSNLHPSGIRKARAMDSVENAIDLLKEQDAVSAHWDDDVGHWIEGDRDGIDPHTRTTGEMIDTFRCSWCGFYLYWETPFCPNCGAKMKGR